MAPALKGPPFCRVIPVEVGRATLGPTIQDDDFSFRILKDEESKPDESRRPLPRFGRYQAHAGYRGRWVARRCPAYALPATPLTEPLTL